MQKETDKKKAREEQERRIAESLRANLRRRKKAKPAPPEKAQKSED